MLTGWVCVALLAICVILPFTPWLMLLRLGGLGLLGPHMWLLERWRCQEEALVAAQEAEYQAASEVEARRLVAQAVRKRHDADDREEAEALDAARKSEARRSDAERERDGTRKMLLGGARRVYRRSRWPHFPKVRSLPELHRSAARPLPSPDAADEPPHIAHQNSAEANHILSGGRSRNVSEHVSKAFSVAGGAWNPGGATLREMV